MRIRRLILGDEQGSIGGSAIISGQLLYSVNMPIREVTITALHHQTPAWIKALAGPLSLEFVIYKYIYGACHVHICMIAFDSPKLALLL